MIPPRLVILISVVCLVATPLRAELIFQPKKSKFNRQWQQAGSDLLDGIARIFDALSALERKDIPSGHRYVRSAIESVHKSMSVYAGVARSATSDQKISIESLAPEEGIGIRKALGEYRVPPPKDEREAAQIAEDESKRLEHSLRIFDEQISKSDIEAVQELLAAVTRVERVGTNTALLIELSTETKR
jgi:hypothetical protein